MHNALWAYRTTMRTSTNATPAELVYGIEVVLPLHVLKPALKFASLIELPLTQYQQKRLMQLDLLDERRLKAAEHAQVHCQRVARQFAKSVIERHFKVNDLVLRSTVYLRGRPRDKWTPNWEGPYVIKEVLPHNSYRLIDADGVEHADPVNALHLKKFYAWFSCIRFPINVKYLCFHIYYSI
uniref:Integrase zinc-binding domain-containing protein n=1 Tax=Nymphaea colorata TaxID=210225 RepID=A0A5K1F1I3_9MAGN|nr:unnamed protein product [Nymphaea colorata]